jgi:hypothetical protein
MDDEFDVRSAHFNPQLALMHPERVRLPNPHVKAFDYFDRCRYLLSRSDPNYLAAPTSTKSNTSTVSSSSSTDRKRKINHQSETNDNADDDDDDGDDQTATVAHKPAKLSYLEDMMAALTNRLFQELAEARKEGRRVSSEPTPTIARLISTLRFRLI